MNDPAKDVEVIFTEAILQLTPGEREAYLNKACGADGRLRRRVDALLAAHDRAGSFMQHSEEQTEAARTDRPPRQLLIEAPAPLRSRDSTCDAQINETEGMVIGRYKLLQKIGEGGFGVVYMAEQEKPVRRRVALKIIKAGMDTRAVIARFEAERQALALMDHPNISRVLDAGATDAGRPYFVMELVKGVPITDYCDQAKLDTAQRLSLFMDVCAAVQHAHQKGVIHRDLKPSNIMITLRDDKPNVKVIDFGIAKATDQKLTEKTLFTAYGQMIGTPAYMSPEQAVMSEFDVDTRSDIYSLGVLLYELLTGSPPFDAHALRSAGFDEMRRIIREQAPQKPSTKLSTFAPATKLTVAGKRQVTPQALSRQLHGDLDWIVLKAIEKDRKRRYESASAFAQDIQRHLKSEPVLAAAPTAGYRLHKFVQRNKGPITVGTAVALLLLAATAVSTWQAVRATGAKRDAVLAALEKGKALDLANAANEQSRRRLKQIEKANDILGSIFESLDPNEIARAERPLQAILVEKLNRAVEQLEGEAIGDPLIVASMQGKFGTSLLGLGEPNKAIVLFKRQRATLEATLGPAHHDTLVASAQLAAAYQNAGRLDLALPLSEETLKLKKAKLGPDHPDTLASMNDLAVAYYAAGKFDLALPLSEETLKLMKAKLGPDDPDTLASMDNLALAYNAAGKLDLALPLSEETVKLMKAILGPDHPDTLNSMGNLGKIYGAAGKPDLALPLLEETLKLEKATLGPDHPQTLTGMNNLAVAYLAAGKFDVALPLLSQTLKLMKAKLGPDHPQTLTIMNNLAEAYQNAGQPDLALPLLEETLKRMKAKLGPDHPKTLTSMDNVALAYQDAGKLDLALPLLEETLKLKKAKLGPDHPQTLTTMNNLAAAYQAAGKLDLAVPLLEGTLKLSRDKLGPDDPHTLTSMANLVQAYQAAGKLELALPLFEEVLRIRKIKLGIAHPDTIAAMVNVAEVYHGLGRDDLSIPRTDQILRLELDAAKPPGLAFWMYDPFKPNPGVRQWKQVDATHWTEFGPHGHINNFTFLSTSGDAENPGTVVRAQPDTGFEVLIPPMVDGAPFKFREKPSDQWQVLCSVHLFAAISVAAAGQRTPLSPATAPSNSTAGTQHAAAWPPNYTFWFDYNFMPDAGARKWKQVDSTHWQEFYPDGRFDLFSVVAKSSDQKNPGTIARRQPDTGFEVLLPPLEQGAPFKYRKKPTAPWTLLGTINLPSAITPPATQSAQPWHLTTYPGDGASDPRGPIDMAALDLPRYEETFRLIKAKLGSDHEYTIASMDNLAETYLIMGGLDLYIPLCAETLKLQSNKLPPDDPEICNRVQNLGSAYGKAGKPEAALPLFERALKLSQASHPDDWATFRTYSMLGGALLDLKKYDAAEQPLLKGYEGLSRRYEAIPKRDKACVAAALERLVGLYGARRGKGDAEAAAKYRKLFDEETARAKATTAAK